MPCSTEYIMACDLEMLLLKSGNDIWQTGRYLWPSGRDFELCLVEGFVQSLPSVFSDFSDKLCFKHCGVATVLCVESPMHAEVAARLSTTLINQC